MNHETFFQASQTLKVYMILEAQIPFVLLLKVFTWHNKVLELLADSRVIAVLDPSLVPVYLDGQEGSVPSRKRERKYCRKKKKYSRSYVCQHCYHSHYWALHAAILVFIAASYHDRVCAAWRLPPPRTHSNNFSWQINANLHCFVCFSKWVLDLLCYAFFRLY